MADAVKAITAKIEEIAKIKKELRVAINNAGGNLSETAPFSEYPDAIATIKNATFKILDKNMNTINITSNGQHSFSVNDDPGFAFTDGIPNSHKGWNSFSFNVNVESGSGSGGSGGGSGSGGSGGGSGSGGSGGGSGSEDSGPALPKFAVFFKVADSDKDPKYPWEEVCVTVEHGEDASPGKEPQRTDYDCTGWNPPPFNLTSSTPGVQKWSSSDPNYVEGTDGYMVCYATWKKITDQITAPWDEIAKNASTYRVGQWAYLNFGRVSYKQFVIEGSGKWFSYKTGQSEPFTLAMVLVNKGGEAGTTWVSRNFVPVSNVIKEFTVDEIKNHLEQYDWNGNSNIWDDPGLAKYFGEKVKQYGDTDFKTWCETNLFKACDDLLKPSIKSVTKKHQGTQSGSGATGITSCTCKNLWPLSATEYREEWGNEGNTYTYPIQLFNDQFSMTRSKVLNSDDKFYTAGRTRYGEGLGQVSLNGNSSLQVGFCI